MRDALTAWRNAARQSGLTATGAILVVATLAALAVNTVPIAAGSGMVLLAGNIFLIATLRLCPPLALVAAAMIGASPLWWLWNDPLQWAVSVAHVAFVARVRAVSPIVATLIFSLTFGAALNALGHIVLSTSADAAWAAWAGSTYNCLAVATFGELLGLALLRSRHVTLLRRRTIGLEAILVALVTAALMVPASAY